ncbi:MAG: exodeoxyribonuclease III [Rhodospirillales bacterium 70-18]|nr:MAG: exodeoxyribonuclease III [Rhodospirillales bacterium 70-18]
MRLATWNVNSIRQREHHVRRWLERAQPDILFLQEIKCEATQFPADAFAAMGYHAEVVGQKTYNGVAALCRVPFTVTHRALPGLADDDAQARYIEGELADGTVTIGIYLPNGNSGGEAGFAYKLAWMEALRARLAALLAAGREVAVLGDFNVCPEDIDLAAGALPPGDALVRPETRARFRALLWLGLIDAVRALYPTERLFTFWDYQAGAWPRDSGLRIDHALLSAGLAERLAGVAVDKDERAMEKASDHVPVVVELA